MTSRRLATALIGLAFCALCRPAAGQIVQPVLSLDNNIGNALTYDPMSFGRGQVTFQFFVTSSNATSLDTTLTATLPAGLSFASTNAGNATVTGDEAAGEVVAVDLGQLSGTLYGYSFAATIGPLPADGAQLAVSFQLSGHASGTTDLQFSNVIAFPVQAGYLPVGIYLANASALCHGTVGSALTGFSRFNPIDLSSDDGSRISASVSDASGAAAAAGTDALPVVVAGGGTATLVGEIGSADSVVDVPGIGYRAQSQGGVFFVVDVSNDSISASPTSSNADCQQAADIEFDNPNAYAVPLMLDQRVSQYSAAGNEAATDPLSGVKFGYPGDADGSSGGIATNSVFYRFLYKRGGNTQETRQSMTCFPEAQDTCDANPPSDSTQSIRRSGGAFSSAGGLLIPAFATTGTLHVDLNPAGNEDVQSFGSTNIATFADTGSVSVVRSGFGTVSIGSVTRLARADQDPDRLNSGTAFLSIATDGGVNILVTDSQGRRIGFQPGGLSTTVPTLPGVPTPQLDVPPNVVTEIFGASYSGTNSQAQLITIPNPTPGDYQITATAATDPPFTVTVEALDINNQVIDRFTESRTVAAGTPTTLTARLDPSGHVSSPGAPGSDTTPPMTTAALAPAPNNAGWNNGDVVVSLTSTDDPGGSGVKQVAYSAAGAESIPATGVAGALAKIALTAEGATTVTFSATDNAGNQETPGSVVVQIDKTPPTITSAQAPQPNQYGWNNSSVTVSFACSDGLSGLAAGSPPASTTLSGEGANQSVSGSCTDVAGNAASTSVQNIAIDLTPPTIAITASAPTLWPPTGTSVPDAISGSITDALSGVDPASLSFQVIDSYGMVQPTGAVAIGSDGTFSFALMLDASREGADLAGRQYQIVVSGRDKAGNTASASTIVTVPHDQR